MRVSLFVVLNNWSGEWCDKACRGRTSRERKRKRRRVERIARSFTMRRGETQENEERKGEKIADLLLAVLLLLLLLLRCQPELLLLQALVEELHSHLNVGRGARDGHETLGAAPTGSDARLRLHDLDVRPAHLPDLVDLLTAFADDAPHQVVGHKDLLRLRPWLELRCTERGRRHGCHGSPSRSAVAVCARSSTSGAEGTLDAPCGAAGARPIGEVVRCPIGVLEEDRPHVVDGNVDGVGDSRDAQDALFVCFKIVSFISISREGLRSSPMTHLCACGEHGFASCQPGTAGLLDLLDLCPLLANNRAHPRVGNDESNRDGSAAGHRSLVKRLVVDLTDDEPECLCEATQ